MHTFLKFIYEMLSQFFSGIKNMFIGIFSGIVEAFNIKRYIEISNQYQNDFTVGEWILFGLTVLVVLAFITIIIIGIVLLL